MCGADPMEIDPQYGQNGTLKMISMKTGPQDHQSTTNYLNPGMIDIHNSNPALGGIYDDLSKMRSDFQGSYDQVMDPGYYNNLRDEYAQRASTNLGNQYARMGLAGSSAETGALSESDRQTALSFRDRMLGEQSRAYGMASGMDKGMEGVLMAGQGQYGQFQDQLLQLTMAGQNAYQQQQAQQMQMWGSIGSAALGAAGTIIGGPAGGAAGAKLGSMGASSLSANPNYDVNVNPGMYGDGGWNSSYGNIGGPQSYGGPDYGWTPPSIG